MSRTTQSFRAFGSWLQLSSQAQQSVHTTFKACRVRNLVIAAGVPAIVYVIAWVLIPGYVTRFQVRPNELARETPYIKLSIEHTRRAFGLDAVEEIPFDPPTTGALFDPAMHAQTLANVRLWDWRALQDTLRQIQEIRTYYDFADVDVDRYVIDGEKRSMMLATRELNLTNLPTGSNSWINERLIYTHGYGVTMNPGQSFHARRPARAHSPGHAGGEHDPVD